MGRRTSAEQEQERNTALITAHQALNVGLERQKEIEQVLAAARSELIAQKRVVSGLRKEYRKAEVKAKRNNRFR